MEESDKNVEKFIDSVIKNASLETPSLDFTSKIMARVEALEQKKVIMYQPLISRKVWILIAMALMSILIYAFSSDESVAYIEFRLTISKIIPTINVPETTSYIVLIVVIMVLIQIPILKNYFDRRFEA